MNIAEYFDAARSTAIYPSNRVYEYPSLGLGGEIGELCMKLAIYEGHAIGVDTVVTLEDIRKEIGDILWYVANTSLDAGIDVDSLLPECCTGMGNATFEKIQESSPLIHPLFLAGHGGVACELAKKYIRDDSLEMSEQRRLKVMLTLVAILFSLGSICNQLSLSLADAAQENLDKLQSRKDRGTLQGSGDNR